jgi:hypothetical protein
MELMYCMIVHYFLPNLRTRPACSSHDREATISFENSCSPDQIEQCLGHELVQQFLVRSYHSWQMSHWSCQDPWDKTFHFQTRLRRVFVTRHDNQKCHLWHLQLMRVRCTSSVQSRRVDQESNWSVWLQNICSHWYEDEKWQVLQD